MSFPTNNGPPELGQTSKSRNNQNNKCHAHDPVSDVFQGTDLQLLKKAFLHLEYDTCEDWVQLLSKIKIVTKSFIDIEIPKNSGISKFKPFVKEAIELGFDFGVQFYMILGETFSGSEDASKLEFGYFTFSNDDTAVFQEPLKIENHVNFEEESSETYLHEIMSMCADWDEIRRWYTILVITKKLLLDKKIRNLKHGAEVAKFLQKLFKVKGKWEKIKRGKEVELRSKDIKVEENSDGYNDEIASAGPSKQSRSSEVQRTEDNTSDALSSLPSLSDLSLPLYSSRDTSSNSSPQALPPSSPHSSSISVPHSIQNKRPTQHEVRALVSQPDPPAPTFTTIGNAVRTPTDVEDPSGNATAIRSKEEYIALMSRYEKEQQDAQEQETEAEQQITHYRERLAEAEATKASSKRKVENSRQKRESVIDRTPLEVTRQLLLQYTGLHESEGDGRRDKRPRTS